MHLLMFRWHPSSWNCSFQQVERVWWIKLGTCLTEKSTRGWGWERRNVLAAPCVCFWTTDALIVMQLCGDGGADILSALPPVIYVWNWLRSVCQPVQLRSRTGTSINGFCVFHQGFLVFVPYSCWSGLETAGWMRRTVHYPSLLSYTSSGDCHWGLLPFTAVILI